MKTKLQSLFIGLAFIVAVHQTTAQVTNLGIAPVAGGQSILYWPTNSTTNYVLQTTASLSSPNWARATHAVGVNAVMVTNSVPAGHFRLLQSTNPPGMALVPAGSFTMGNYLVNSFNQPLTNDPDIKGINDPPNTTNVYVSAFYMDVNLVDVDFWQAVYHYATNNGYTFDDTELDGGTNYPIYGVTWYDSVKWCNARSQETGLTPCYYTDAAFTQMYKTGDVDNVYVKWNADGFRLPTEAEWEKAARGGQTGKRFPWGNIITDKQADYTAMPGRYSYDLNSYAGYTTNVVLGKNSYTCPVGSFAPNGYGLYDMGNNCPEWCWDWYWFPRSTYPPGTPYLGGRDPTGPAGPDPDPPAEDPGQWRVRRGCGISSVAVSCQCAYRNAATPDWLDEGFRCVRRP